MPHKHYDTLKRAMDIGVSAVGLVVSAPIQLLTAALVLAAHGRPVLFRQPRPGKDGVVKLKEIMKSLRENPPKELAGKKVLAVRDYLADTRTDCEGHVTPAGLPKSDVLYFELVDDAWVCIRPSGTEPKIKLYVNTNAKHPEDSAKENAELVEACKALMA